MPTFVTVKEAARLTGKSPSAVRRVIYPILKDDHHADRIHIQPGVDEALRLRTKGETFPWRLEESFLRRVMPVEPASERGTAQAAPRSAGDGELLAMLRRELDIKNQQITQQMDVIGKQAELINGLSERLKEGNILMGSLQQRLALPDGRESRPIETVKPKNAAPAKPEKGTTAPAKAAKAKKGLFSRLFR